MAISTGGMPSRCGNVIVLASVADILDGKFCIFGDSGGPCIVCTWTRAILWVDKLLHQLGCMGPYWCTAGVVHSIWQELGLKTVSLLSGCSRFCPFCHSRDLALRASKEKRSREIAPDSVPTSSFTIPTKTKLDSIPALGGE